MFLRNKFKKMTKKVIMTVFKRLVELFPVHARGMNDSVHP